MEGQEGEVGELTDQQKMNYLAKELEALKEQLKGVDDDRSIELTRTQFNTLIKKGRHESEDDDDDAMSIDFNPGEDTVQTARHQLEGGRDIQPLHDNPPVKGSRDVKGARYPAPFAGHKEDARPFIRRLQAYWSLTPKASRLSRNRILIACQLIQTEPATLWASSVTEATTLFTNNSYYFYAWENFKDAFLASFGVPNEKSHAMNKLTGNTQGYSDLIPWITEFERLQLDTGLSDDAALHFFKKNINARLFDEVSKARPEAVTLDDWKKEALRCDKSYQEKQDFKHNQRADRGYRTGNSFASFAFKPAPTKTAAHGSLLKPPKDDDDDRMQIDALGHCFKKKGKGKDRTDKKSSSKPTKVKAPLPAPKRPTQPPVYNPTKGKISMADARCHRCGIKGHFMRDCVTRMNQLSEEHIRALAEFALNRDINPEEIENEEESTDTEEEDTEVEETPTHTESEVPEKESDFRKD